MASCEPLAKICIESLASWITKIPFEDWPQQSRLADNKIRPAMVNQLDWNCFGSITDPIVFQLMRHFPDRKPSQRMLSVVMPGHFIEPHRDEQGLDWVTRVHVPITSNRRAYFISDGIVYHLHPGMSYRVDTRVEHSITNQGETPRIHFMFDVVNA